MNAQFEAVRLILAWAYCAYDGEGRALYTDSEIKQAYSALLSIERALSETADAEPRASAPRSEASQ